YSTSLQHREQRFRLRNLGKFRRRRECFEGGCKDGDAIGGAVRVPIELRQRQCRTQLEALCFLLLGNCDGGEESFLRWRSVRWVALEQNLTADMVQDRIGPVLSRLLSECQRFVKKC